MRGIVIRVWARGKAIGAGLEALFRSAVVTRVSRLLIRNLRLNAECLGDGAFYNG
jgi:hypothetical protein